VIERQLWVGNAAALLKRCNMLKKTIVLV